MTVPYAAYATLKDGTPHRCEFQTEHEALEHVLQVGLEGGACFVVRDGAEVIFKTYEALEDVLLHGRENLLYKTINSL